MYFMTFNIYTSGSQTGATWLTEGGIFNSWEEICSREKLGRKAVDEKFLYFVMSLFST